MIRRPPTRTELTSENERYYAINAALGARDRNHDQSLQSSRPHAVLIHSITSLIRRSVAARESFDS
jgi:hypothetical protein